MTALLLSVLLATTLAISHAADPVCPEVEDPDHPVHYPHPTDCSKFLTCSWGTLMEQECPEHLYWNDAQKRCDYREYSNCDLVSPSTVSTVSPTAESTNEPTNVPTAGPTSTPPTQKCPEQYDPNNQVFLPHADCSKYYICGFNGEPLEQNCPPGLHWNQGKGYCDYPSEAGCLQTPTPPPAPSPPTTSSSTNDQCPDFYDPNNQVFFPHVDCAKYYVCTYEGNKVEQVCPPNLHWSQALHHCDEPAIAQCIPPVDPYQCPPGFDPAHVVYLPHSDCHKYFVCMYGSPIEQVCPQDNHWNKMRVYCDIPQYAGCDASVNPTTAQPTIIPTAAPTEPSTAQPPFTPTASPTDLPSTTSPAGSPSTSPPSPPFPEPSCPVEEFGFPTFYPHENCSKYYVCDHGKLVEMECPKNTWWNESLNTCDAPAHSGCHNRV